jgi:hypothetical protein
MFLRYQISNIFRRKEFNLNFKHLHDGRKSKHKDGQRLKHISIQIYSDLNQYLISCVLSDRKSHNLSYNPSYCGIFAQSKNCEPRGTPVATALKQHSFLGNVRKRTGSRGNGGGTVGNGVFYGGPCRGVIRRQLGQPSQFCTGVFEEKSQFEGSRHSKKTWERKQKNLHC